MFSKPKLICKNCGSQGKPTRKVRGSLGMELLLWIAAGLGLLFFFLPGVVIGCVALVYSLWRASSASRVKVCASCGGENCLIPVSSPEGRRLVSQYAAASVQSK